MAAWHEDARFDVFTDCDVFVESPGHYLYVENQAYNYNGDYVCREYQQGTNLDGTKFYMVGEYAPASNDYIMGLKPAPWNIARDVIARELITLWEEETMASEDVERADDILMARDALLSDAVEGEKFEWC